VFVPLERLGTEATWRYANLTAEGGGQMALIKETDLLRDRSQRAIGALD